MECSLSYAHCICHVPGLPFRIFSNSIFHAGKPIPGISPVIIDGSDEIFQRAVHAFVFIFRGLFLMRKPVTPLCSTANCNLLDAVKVISATSPITAASPSHFRASSTSHKSSFGFLVFIKMILSGSTLKNFSAAGNIACEGPIQTDTPPLLMSDESKHEINPEVAAISSAERVKNSCIDAKGKTPLGKEESIGPNTGRIRSSDALHLNPCN